MHVVRMIIKQAISLLKESYECVIHGYSLRSVITCKIPYRNIPMSTIFPHPFGIFIGPRVKLGENCIIRQNVTIGTRWVFDGKEVQPHVGDNVHIGAGSILLGSITVGDNVKIGAGSIVLKDVPDNTTVIGVYK